MKIFTVSEFARLANVNRQTVYQWIRRGSIQAFRILNRGQWYFTQEQVKRSLPFLEDEDLKSIGFDVREKVLTPPR